MGSGGLQILPMVCLLFSEKHIIGAILYLWSTNIAANYQNSNLTQILDDSILTKQSSVKTYFVFNGFFMEFQGLHKHVHTPSHIAFT